MPSGVCKPVRNIFSHWLGTQSRLINVKDDPFLVGKWWVTLRSTHPTYLPLRRTGISCIGLQTQSLSFQRRLYEGFEQRMRGHGLGFELWMKLASEEPGMILKLYDFNQFSVR